MWGITYLLLNIAVNVLSILLSAVTIVGVILIACLAVLAIFEKVTG